MECPFCTEGSLTERDIGRWVKNFHFIGDVLNGCSLNSTLPKPQINTLVFGRMRSMHSDALWVEALKQWLHQPVDCFKAARNSSAVAWSVSIGIKARDCSF